MTRAIQKGAFSAVVLFAALCLMLAFAGTAHAERSVLNATDAGLTVSDAVTDFNLNKLDPETHEFVEGAHMVLKEKDSGVIVAEWDTGKSGHELLKTLNVGTTYVLTETAAPKGYQKASDTVFVIDPTEAVGIKIISGENAELLNQYTIALYDKRLSSENVITYTELNDNEVPLAAPRTGDDSQAPFYAAFAVVALLAAAGIHIWKRRLVA